MASSVSSNSNEKGGTTLHLEMETTTVLYFMMYIHDWFKKGDKYVNIYLLFYSEREFVMSRRLIRTCFQ